MSERKKDLEPKDSVNLSWHKDGIEASLGIIFQDVSEEAMNAINWYLNKKRRKKNGAVFTRVGMIVMVSIAGIFPMLVQIFSQWNIVIQPVWTSVFIGVAAALAALDRFFGFTSGWVRYIASETRLRQILSEFNLEWESKRAKWEGEIPNSDQVQEMISLAKSLVTQVNTIVQKETGAWIAEFKSSLKDLDDAIKIESDVSDS